MADDKDSETEATTTEETAPPSSKRGLITVVVSVVAGLTMGGLVGMLALGPRMASSGSKSKASAPPAESAQSTATDSAVPAEAPRKPSDGPPPIYQIDNLVLNPAGSGGAHFLLLSVALEAKDAASVETIKLRDAELRDRILRLFGSKTADQVAEASSRDELRAEVVAAVNQMFGSDLVRKVYFPQFVIQ